MGYLPFKKVLLFTALLLALGAAGCVSLQKRVPPYQPLSVQQRAAMQTKELSGNFDIGFAATISVLQDEGWQIDVVDKPSGIIQASSLRRQDIIGPGQDWYARHESGYRNRLMKKARKDKQPLPEWTRWERLTAHIEAWGTGTIRHRITITRVGTLPTHSYYTGKNKQTLSMGGGKEQTIIVEDPATYQYLFQQVQRAIFIRQGLQGK